MALNKVFHPTKRGKRYQQQRESKVNENDKTAVFIRGDTDELTKEVMKELVLLKKPLAKMYKRKNPFRPFDDPTSIEGISKKEDASLFAFGSHSKKRPRNLVLGRLFDYRILDMFEFGIENFKSMKEFDCAKIALGSKPCLVFVGEQFDIDPELIRLKNLLADFFRGPKTSQVRLAGIEIVLQFTVKDGKIFFRCYRIQLKKSGTKIPRVELKEVGPSIDLVMRRNKIATESLFKEARKIPKAAKPKKQKNISFDTLGSKHGTVHMKPQDMNKLQTRKVRALKRRRTEDHGNKETPENTESSSKQQRTGGDEEIE